MSIDQRKTLDKLIASAGMVIFVVLAAAGGLAAYASNYIGGQVHDQLAAQQIALPATTDAGFKALPKADQNAIAPYAGQLVLTGQQAKVFADNYIAVHLSEMPYKGVYAKVSAASRANPNDQKLAAEVDTVFKGTTLRAMLLDAYAFGTMGTVAGVAAIVAFIASAFMLVLSVLGFVHAQRVRPTRE